MFCNVSKEMVSDREVVLCRYPAFLGRDATLLKIIKRARRKVIISHLQVFSHGFEFVCDWSLNIIIKSIGDIHSLVIMSQNHCALHSSKMEPSDACHGTFIITVCCCQKLLSFLFFPRENQALYFNQVFEHSKSNICCTEMQFSKLFAFSPIKLGFREKITLNCMTKCIGCLRGCIKA